MKMLSSSLIILRNFSTMQVSMMVFCSSFDYIMNFKLLLDSYSSSSSSQATSSIKHNMNISIIILLVVALWANQSEAQYPYEDCHYQCDVVYCDYYTNYCEYDCYEVCYPYRSSQVGLVDQEATKQQQQSMDVRERHQSDRSAFKTGKLHTTTNQKVTEDDCSELTQHHHFVRSGKSMKMKLMSPKYLKNGQLVPQGTFAPESFAWSDNCSTNQQNLKKPAATWMRQSPVVSVMKKNNQLHSVKQPAFNILVNQ